MTQSTRQYFLPKCFGIEIEIKVEDPNGAECFLSVLLILRYDQTSLYIEELMGSGMVQSLCSFDFTVLIG